MSKRIKNWMLISLVAVLSACGGDDLSNSTDSDSDGRTEDTDTTTNVSFLPLMTYESYEKWNEAANSDVYLSYTRSPFIKHLTINPVDGSTLASITTAKVSDYLITEDGLPLDPKVSFPMLQKVIGQQLRLRTALVINTSSSMDSVNKDAFIQSIKDYVSETRNNSNYYIANQEYTVWGYSGLIVEETNNATSNVTEVKSALDSVLTKWKANSYEGSSGANHTYDAIVEAIGQYNGEGEYASPSIVYRDTGTEDNDLEDYVTPDYIKASSIILFSNGRGTPNSFGPEFVDMALKSHGTKVYTTATAPGGSSTESELLAKPFVYVVPGDISDSDSSLKSLANTVVNTTITGGKYSYSNEIIATQIASLDAKHALENQHVLRWASAIRSGSDHKRLVETLTPDDQYGFALSADIDFKVSSILPMPEPQVEITGANNEYIATNPVDIDAVSIENPYDSAITYANHISKFYPSTRWTNQEFDTAVGGDYEWEATPSDSIIINSDNSASIASGATYPITLKLTNNNIEHQGGTITDDFTITIEKSN